MNVITLELNYIPPLAVQCTQSIKLEIRRLYITFLIENTSYCIERKTLSLSNVDAKRIVFEQNFPDT